jgi:hypothetical protein
VLVVLGVGAIVVPLAGSIAGASAQSNSLLRPELYGDPKGPAVRFQKSSHRQQHAERSVVGRVHFG